MTGAVERTHEQAARLQRLHTEGYARLVTQVRPLPGAGELLAYLSRVGAPWAVATSGWLESARLTLEMLGVDPAIPVITRDQVRHAKPDPDLFLAAANRLGAEISASVVVGDSVWDLLAARRARALGVGLLSGGYGQDELERAGAYRVYQDPADCSDTSTRWGSGWPNESLERAGCRSADRGRCRSCIRGPVAFSALLYGSHQPSILTAREDTFPACAEDQAGQQLDPPRRLARRLARRLLEDTREFGTAAKPCL